MSKFPMKGQTNCLDEVYIFVMEEITTKISKKNIFLVESKLGPVKKVMLFSTFIIEGRIPLDEHKNGVKNFRLLGNHQWLFTIVCRILWLLILNKSSSCWSCLSYKQLLTGWENWNLGIAFKPPKRRSVSVSLPRPRKRNETKRISQNWKNIFSPLAVCDGVCKVVEKENVCAETPSPPTPTPQEVFFTKATQSSWRWIVSQSGSGSCPAI